jgi:hypothetical protein
MMQYEKPKMELIEFASADADVITASPLVEIPNDSDDDFDF